MSTVDTLARHLPDLEFELPDGTSVVKLGLIITLYFREGYTTENKQRVMACFEAFNKSFGPCLKGQFQGRFKKMTQGSFDKTLNTIANTGPNEQYEWHICSATNATEASSYSLSVLNSFELHGDQKRSYIKCVFPWSYLKHPDGRARYEKWLITLCNSVRAEHGYGGLSSILPYDYFNYMPSEYALAQQFYGLDVDSMAHVSTLELIDSIKGANWYTVLANTFVTRLGGEASLRHALSAQDDIEILTYNNGLIIRAGEYPELGALEDGPPAAYVAVNQVIKPIRITHPDQLHCASPYGTCFDQDSTHRWYARFDR